MGSAPGSKQRPPESKSWQEERPFRIDRRARTYIALVAGIELILQSLSVGATSLETRYRRAQRKEPRSCR
jgi:hypothetical protein